MQKKYAKWLEWLAQTAWSVLSGILNAIAGLFGYRQAPPRAVHENIAIIDVDEALEKARADQARTDSQRQEPQLEVALDLIWHFVNAPATDRPWIDLGPLDERQRTWLLSLPDSELGRLAEAGRMAAIEAALTGRRWPARATNRSRMQENDQEIAADAGQLLSKADQVREQFVLRVVRGLRNGDGSLVPGPESDDPAFVAPTFAGNTSPP